MTGVSSDINIPGRLRWLCQRGMLELDAWLTSFLDSRYHDAPPPLQADFAALLEQDDMSLFDWLTDEAVPPERFRTVVHAIRSNRILS